MTGRVLTPADPPGALALESLLSGRDSLVTWVGTDGSRWPISGGLAPRPPVAEGVQLLDIKGLHGPLKHVDQQGAHEDGVTYLDTVYDAAEIDMTLVFFGRDQIARRRVFRRWLAGWEPKRTGRLWWFTAETGHWWMNLRLLQEPRDVLKAGDAAAVQMAWSARGDRPFWVSFDSISTTLIASDTTTLADPAGKAAPNFLPVWNRGDQDGWPVHLLQGPGVFSVGDNGGPRRITVPLNIGELARVTTLPNRRTVVEVNTGANIYPRVRGRFSTPVPAGASVRIPVTVTGATPGVTSAVSSLTPWRRWPE
ncbi:hypothetical protein [Nocardia terpenica]|uniref:Uncharacterized protein n=1 Tax=Nocardia terpenica TaxID=455432 RepID=A0A164JV73_9NOCA|nr:hypothetical protein [Nocardia terpenica]KZM70753.1 hypothetical protein AWN90_40040 [Nocardia terpenica]NQE89981.1 hypothetical protein [Nocardia terpenica]